MSLALALIGGLTVGFALGSLAATVAHLNKEIADAEHNGHRP
jgi:hypothetical protein